MTLFLIAITVLISLLALSRADVFDKMKFNAYFIHHNKEWYRFLSYGLIHADWMHLFINMFVLYSFGSIVEELFRYQFRHERLMLYFLLLYIGGIGFSTLFDYGKYKNDIYYNAVGASGAVSAVVFSSIILYPAGKIFLFHDPDWNSGAIIWVDLPGLFSLYGQKRNRKYWSQCTFLGSNFRSDIHHCHQTGIFYTFLGAAFLGN